MMKVVQITATEAIGEDGDASGTLYALCSDGSLWLLVDPWHSDNEWRELKVPERTGPRPI